MGFNQVSRLLLSLVLLSTLVRVSSEPFQCVNWRKVYPSCPCIPALDGNGLELPSVAVVDCSSKDLTSVPKTEDVFTRPLYEFRLSDNRITTLPNNAFQGVKIRHLDLTGNRMGSIADDAFSGLEDELLLLEIEGDSVSQPQMNAISKVNKLEELTMKNYNVSHLGTNINTGEKEYLFNPFSKLKRLTLDNWGIESIDAHAFLKSGTANSMASLTLLNQKLLSLPVDVLHAQELHILKTLHISHTEVSEITAYIFSELNEVKEIILSDNKINSIKSNSFKGVGDTLERIDLSNNFLGNAGTNDLPHLSELYQLKQLILHNNNLISVPKMENIGDGLPFHLDLSKNNINKLSGNDLAHYGQRLQSLDLSLNKIVEIDSQIFSGVTLLQSLILKNQLGSSAALKVPTSLTQALNLKYLDVSGRTVEPLGLWEALKKLEKLETLILHSVDLTSIPDLAFENLAHLTTLELSFNSINQITDKTFVGPRSLQKLTLRSNEITALPPCLFHRYEYSKELSLDLGSMYITCDCSIKTLLEKYHTGNITFPDENSTPKCQNSEMYLTDKKQQDLASCEPEKCADTPTLPPPTTTDDSGPSPTPTVQMTVESISTTSIEVTWHTTNTTGFKSYTLKVTSPQLGTKEHTISSVGTTKKNITNLTANTNYNICVYVQYNDRPEISDCETLKTSKDPTKDKQTSDDDADPGNIGIIVGCIVGVLALLAIIAAIVYIAIIRRRPKKMAGPTGMMGPVQPRTFAKSELPSMNGDSRSFVKAKKSGAAAEPKAIGSMKVVAISDGQTGPSSSGRIGRAHLLSPDGTYEPMGKFKYKDQDYEPMEKRYGPMEGACNSAYENDHGSLPPTPTKQQSNPSPPPTSDHGYVNGAFSKYDEVTQEVTV